MNGQSLDILQDRINQLKQLFPETVTEGKIDFEALKQCFGEVTTTAQERYHLDWAGKQDAYRAIQQQTAATLIPTENFPENSNPADVKYENIFAEGENLEVLKVLQKSYFGKIKMIYIDPPYNTGNDSFIYPDKFSETKAEYLKRINDIDDNGYLMKEGFFRPNSRENGQYHSNWLSMMLPRLYIARNLLRDDGVIFVSIDDNEVHNLRLIMNEVFGEENFVSEFIWKSKSGGANDSRFIANDHEYILCFAKTSENLFLNLDKNATVTTSYNLHDEKGKYSLDRLDKQSLGYIQSLDFPIKDTDGKIYTVQHKNPENKVARWRWGKETVKERFNELVFKDGFVYTKNYQKDGSIPRSLLIEERFGRTRTGKTDFAALFDIAYFTAPKPHKLLEFLIQISTTENNDLILDFFAGSGTTAQAVLELNREDGGNRKFICVQLPEKTDEKSEAYKAGYKTIADICKERIKRVINKIQDEEKGKLDFETTETNKNLGFRCFKLVPSNFKQWNTAIETEAELLNQQFDFETPQKTNAKEINMLYELLIKSGFPLTIDIEQLSEIGEQIYQIADKVFIFSTIDEKAIDVLLKKPISEIIALDSVFNNQDKLKTNIAEQCKQSEKVKFTSY